MYVPYNEGMYFCESKIKAFKKSALFLDMYNKSIKTSNKKTTKQHYYHESRPTSLSFTQEQAFCHNATIKSLIADIEFLKRKVIELEYALETITPKRQKTHSGSGVHDKDDEKDAKSTSNQNSDCSSYKEKLQRQKNIDALEIGCIMSASNNLCQHEDCNITSVAPSKFCRYHTYVRNCKNK